MAKITADIINQSIPEWQHPVLPGQAVQGSILFTTTDFTNPPQSQSNFIWMAMEDIIGVANVRVDYDEEENLYTLYKAKGHLDNNGGWHYEWEAVAIWTAKTQQHQEGLKNLVYVSYRYDTTIPNRLLVYGTRKDGSEDMLCNISFASKEEFNTAITTLNNRCSTIETNLNNEINRATNRENTIETNLDNEIQRAVNRESELQQMIQQATINPGIAIEVVGTDNQVNVKYDNDSIKVNGSNQLKADVFNDTEVSNTKGWSSAKITQELTSAMHYKGQVATYNDLPTTGQAIGDLYNVEDTGDNYAWNGTSWDKLSGEYIAGAGIDITGKVVSANIDQGLEIHSDKIRAKIGDGIMYDANDALKAKGNPNAGIDVNADGISVKVSDGILVDSNGVYAKAGNGINVDSNGINVTVGDTTQLVSDKVEVKPNKGLINETTGVSINANFNVKETPLGTDSSKLAIYSDGKIAVDFEEEPVVLTQELLITFEYEINTNSKSNILVPNMNQYDMYAIQLFSRRTSDNLITIYGQSLIQKANNITNTNVTLVLPATTNTTGTPPTGVLFMIARLRDIDSANDTIGEISTWNKNDMNNTNWNQYNSASAQMAGINIYGIRVK